MPSLSRYLAGDHEPVWVVAGELVGREPLGTEALAVARATMARVADNLRLLHTRLHALGFVFAAPDEALVFADPDAPAQLDALEAELGPLALSARAWFETFASVRFEQAEAQLRGEVGPAALHGLGSHPALIVRGFAWGRADYLTAREGWSDPDATPPTLAVGPVCTASTTSASPSTTATSPASSRTCATASAPAGSRSGRRSAVRGSSRTGSPSPTWIGSCRSSPTVCSASDRLRVRLDLAVTSEQRERLRLGTSATTLERRFFRSELVGTRSNR